MWGFKSCFFFDLIRSLLFCWMPAAQTVCVWNMWNNTADNQSHRVSPKKDHKHLPCCFQFASSWFLTQASPVVIPDICPVTLFVAGTVGIKGAATITAMVTMVTAMVARRKASMITSMTPSTKGLFAFLGAGSNTSRRSRCDRGIDKATIFFAYLCI